MCSNCRTLVTLDLPRGSRWAEGPRTEFWRLSQTATIPYMLAIYTLHFWAPAAPGPLWATRLAWLPAWLPGWPGCLAAWLARLPGWPWLFGCGRLGAPPAPVVGPRAPELNFEAVPNRCNLPHTHTHTQYCNLQPMVSQWCKLLLIFNSYL